MDSPLLLLEFSDTLAPGLTVPLSRVGRRDAVSLVDGLTELELAIDSPLLLSSSLLNSSPRDLLLLEPWCFAQDGTQLVDRPVSSYPVT